MNISIIGAGSWGTALANLLVKNSHEVLVYDVDETIIEEINTKHTNFSKLKDGVLEEGVVATNDLNAVLDFSNIIILSVPTKVLRIVLNNIKKIITSKKIFVNTSKGIEPDTCLRISEVVAEVLTDEYLEAFVALTGPSHAEEVILSLPTLVTSVSDNIEAAKLIQTIFSNDFNFRVYTSTDLLGAELGGALKNIYAIASGMLTGVGYGDNARAALITRALVEMQRLALSLGASEKTLLGLSGVGDLIVTTTSHHSRNFQAGYAIAKGKNLKEAVSSIPMVVEGARTTLSAYQMARKQKVETPIIDAVYAVIYEEKDVSETINNLMKRSLKDEF